MGRPAGPNVIAREPEPVLSRFPEPLRRDIYENRCLPIIGAGFSRNAILPAGAAMPLWSDVGKSLARACGYDNSDPADAASEFERRRGRQGLADELRRLIQVGVATPGPVHQSFCRLPFDVVCTTNWDALIEDGYRSVGHAFRVASRDSQLAIGTRPGSTLLVKFHGDLDDPESLVVTEQDYDGFTQERPLMATYVSGLLIVRTALFIGFSTDDPDFRQLWQVLSGRLGRLRRQAYALTVAVSTGRRARLERRAIQVIDV